VGQAHGSREAHARRHLGQTPLQIYVWVHHFLDVAEFLLRGGATSLKKTGTDGRDGKDGRDGQDG